MNLNLNSAGSLFSLLIIFIIISCTNRKDVVNSNYELDTSISKIVGSFVVTYPEKQYYALYINKISPDKNILILFAGNNILTGLEDSIYAQKPLIRLNSNGKIINVYSGAERYLTKKQNSRLGASYPSKKIIPRDKSNSDFWVIFDEGDTLIVDKNYQTVYPFMPLPDTTSIELSPPVIKH